MSIETASELHGMKRAGHITALALDALEANVRVGMTTAELDASAGRMFGLRLFWAALNQWLRVRDSIDRLTT